MKGSYYVKIVIDARELRTSTGRYVERLLHYLQQIDTTNAYEILLKPNDISSWEATNPNFNKVECPHKEFTFSEQIELLRQLNALKPDLVHFAMVQQPVLYRGSVVTTMHDLTTTRFINPEKNLIVFKLKQTVYKWLNKRVARKSDQILVPTWFVKKDISDYARIPEDKIQVTNEAADEIPGPAAKIENLSNRKFIFYVGRAQPHKNLEKLIKTFEILYTSQPELFLVLVGKKDSSYERIEKLAAHSPARENIVFTGFISDAELKWLYQNAQAYVFPSLSEGFGLPGLEAMVHGCPVISSNATCLPEVYEDAVIYFDPTNPRDMADKIHSVLNDPELRRDLIAKGHAQAAKYSWRRMAEQTLEVYKSTLTNQ